ncbi:MAG: hypothetical protein H7138_02625 [Myxococcales bacterium]|nr:hypothetical protein [Myxococcales bacterium]
MIFSLVVIAVAISVVTMYVRHGQFMRRKRLAERDAGEQAEPPAKPNEPNEPNEPR